MLSILQLPQHLQEARLTWELHGPLQQETCEQRARRRACAPQQRSAARCAPQEVPAPSQGICIPCIVGLLEPHWLRAFESHAATQVLSGPVTLQPRPHWATACCGAGMLVTQIRTSEQQKRCSELLQGGHLVAAMGACTNRPPLLSLMTVMRTFVETLLPPRLCCCSKHQMLPRSTWAATTNFTGRPLSCSSSSRVPHYMLHRVPVLCRA